MRQLVLAAFAATAVTLALPAMARLEDPTSPEAVSGVKAALEGSAILRKVFGAIGH